MASTTSGKGLGVIVAIVILALFAGIVLPAMINAYNTDSTEAFIDVEEGDTVEVVEGLSVTLDSVYGDESIDVTVESAETADAEQLTNITVGETQTAVVDAYNVSVTNVNVNANSRVTLEVEYPDTFGWDDGAETVFDQLPVLFMVFVLVVSLGWLVKD